MIEFILRLCFLVIIVEGREFTAQEYAMLPRLFDLEDYHECLSLDDGLYCLGTFHLTPREEHDPVYDLMQEYSSKKFAFNRTLIHRGYCLSQHCPDTTSNATLRFERCVAKWAEHKGFYSTLSKLDYCCGAKTLNGTPNIPQLMFIYTVLAILLLNVIGTVCDITNYTKGGSKNIINSWSIRINWKKLTTLIYEQKDPKLTTLAPVQGGRVLVLAIFVLAHSKFVHYMVYLQNPRDIEKDLEGPVGVLFTNGSTTVQFFVIISSFLCAHNLLFSKKKLLLLSTMPKHILKRIIRIAPVHLLLVGFGATWYAHTRDGPLWPALVEKEQQVCQNKFWTHVLFVNNFIEPENKCFVQTWFLAVDMQLYIVSLLLTVILAKIGRGKLKILFSLYFTSLFFVSLLAYLNGWQSMLYITVPESMHDYMSSPSVEHLYITPFGHLSSCLAGLILAHLQNSVQERSVKVHNWKWLVHAQYLCIPLYVAWLLSGVYIRETFTSAIAVAAYVGVERLVFNVCLITIMFGIINIDSPLRRFFAWRGWDLFARLSLPVLMIHWAVIMTIIASRPTLIYSTFLDVMVDSTATLMITYALAIPASVLVEIPMQRILDYFI